MPRLSSPCVVLISGGLDSTVVLAVAHREGFSPHCLTIRYGQRHLVEIDAARRTVALFGDVPHKILDIDLSALVGSALTGSRPVPKSEGPVSSVSIPPTYVPARNTVFLSLATAWAESLDARDIFIGVSAVDYSGYPDCRPAFISAFEKTVNLGTRAVEGGPRFRIHTPLIHLSKAETILLGAELGVDFGHTWSCYDPSLSGQPCKQCDACRLRAKGFFEAGLSDPLAV
ncbi:MAG: 7-cyano-7-deazaguanine synthase QueC [Myxococcota bacterium]|nr:7-cyano-7-deazaguanine synthase QueC [Myxococcota bacterium]